jgi:rare lipoprotein A
MFTNVSLAQKSYKKTGYCSYYADNLHGNKTSSGERLHIKRKTAAHKSLPFNTLVKVMNLENGRSSIVRVNDRGPYSHKRIIDVSKIAAIELGLLGSGTAKVKIEVIGFDDRSADEIKAHELKGVEEESDEPIWVADSIVKAEFETLIHNTVKPLGYGIQIGIFKDKLNAQKQLAGLANLGITSIFIETPILDNITFYRIFVGEYVTREAALKDIALLQKNNFDTYFKLYN